MEHLGPVSSRVGPRSPPIELDLGAVERCQRPQAVAGPDSPDGDNDFGFQGSRNTIHKDVVVCGNRVMAAKSRQRGRQDRPAQIGGHISKTIQWRLRLSGDYQPSASLQVSKVD